MKVAIIEPNLVDYTGHYYSFVSELKRGFEELGDQVDIFLPKNSKVEIEGAKRLLSPSFPQNAMIKKYMSFLKKALKIAAICKIAQKRSDLVIFSTADNGEVLNATGFFNKTKPVILYFHILTTLARMRMKSWKVFEFLIKLRKPQNLYILTTSGINSVGVNIPFLSHVKLFQNAPYPLKNIAYLDEPNRDSLFYLAYMGAPAKRKNFAKLIELIRLAPEDLGFIIQCTPHAANFYDSDIQDAVKTLKGLGSKNLILLESSLPKESYFKALNQSSIVWCLYDSEWYKESISGIFLEAWSLGKPVITTHGTWMAKQVQKYGGGIVLENLEIPEILKAVEKIKSEYEKFSAEAKRAGRILHKENNGHALARFIKEIVKNDLAFPSKQIC